MEEIGEAFLVCIRRVVKNEWWEPVLGDFLNTRFVGAARGALYASWLVLEGCTASFAVLASLSQDTFSFLQWTLTDAEPLGRRGVCGK